MYNCTKCTIFIIFVFAGHSVFIPKEYGHPSNFLLWYVCRKILNIWLESHGREKDADHFCISLKWKIFSKLKRTIFFLGEIKQYGIFISFILYNMSWQKRYIIFSIKLFQECWMCACFSVRSRNIMFANNEFNLSILIKHSKLDRIV